MHNKHNDLVSVIMPVYNGEPFLQAAIASIVEQTYQNIELLVLDDGSTDSSSEIVLQFTQKDPRIKLISRPNRGLGATLNELISLASSEYIARMDSDDISELNRIETQLSLIKSDKNCVMTGSQIEFITPNSTTSAFPMPLEHSEIRKGLLQARFPICHPSIMFRKSAATKIGGYSVLGAGEDLDFFLKMSEIGKICNTKEKLFKYRIQPNSLSIKKARELNKAYSFAIHNANLRNKKEHELSQEEYSIIWNNRGLYKRIRDSIHNFSERVYRQSITLRSDGLLISSYIYLLLAALLRPTTTAARIKHVIKERLSTIKTNPSNPRNF